MYVLSHGCIMSSYNAFFNLHTWVCLSCVLTSSGCKCLFVVYAFFSWEASWYESCLVSHNVSIYCMMELRTSLQVSILHPRHHSSFCIIRVNLELSSLVLWNKSHPSFLVGDCTWYFLQVKCTSCMIRNIS